MDQKKSVRFRIAKCRSEYIGRTSNGIDKYALYGFRFTEIIPRRHELDRNKYIPARVSRQGIISSAPFAPDVTMIPVDGNCFGLTISKYLVLPRKCFIKRALNDRKISLIPHQIIFVFVSSGQNLRSRLHKPAWNEGKGETEEARVRSQ